MGWWGDAKRSRRKSLCPCIQFWRTLLCNGGIAASTGSLTIGYSQARTREDGTLTGDKRSCVEPSGRRTGPRHPKAVWLAYLPAHILDSVAKRWNGIQGHARNDAAFLIAINSGYLHTGSHACQARSSGGGTVARFFS